MKVNGAPCQVDSLTSPYKPQQKVGFCRIQANGHACRNGTGSAPSSAKRRSNGVVPHTSKSSDCGTGWHVGPANQRGAGKVLVTGGAGYVGHSLGRALAVSGVSVILLDLLKPRWEIPQGAVFHQSDIRDYDALFTACEGVDCIFHTASYGMSGPEQLKKEQIESVNVWGTSNVINVCTQRSIPRLVYTSTVNVVFAGSPIEQGDEETVPCVPLDKLVDHYSKSKAVADQMILSANGRTLKDGGFLRTCVLRPPGIYGPGERRHLQRVAVNIERRLFSFSFGNRNAKINWVHVDNLVMAHVLAAEALTAGKHFVASGQAYYINDGEAVNLFEWLMPLFEKLGHSRPVIHLPVSLVYTAAVLMECVHVALRPVVQVPLLFTRNEVRNIAVTHTFKIDKACRQLGFCPKRYDLADSVHHYLKTRQPRPGLLLLCFRAGLLFLSLVALLFFSCFWQDRSGQESSNTTLS
ncbi:putative short-chain dehydrogenase/reductase family 42E member 2 [Amia ocellicauda]|uniref:putative short-chain dehydrogenase/reductase family 42E member 2 n=1 Tax=Amia ocellicauda TaxID=2972642 RepID=UPI003463F5F4